MDVISLTHRVAYYVKCLILSQGKFVEFPTASNHRMEFVQFVLKAIICTTDNVWLMTYIAKDTILTATVKDV